MFILLDFFNPINIVPLIKNIPENKETNVKVLLIEQACYENIAYDRY